MSKDFEKYIIQHKKELDDKMPDPLLFDEIMNQLEQKRAKPKVVFLPIYRKMVMAASILLVLTIGLAVFLTNNQREIKQEHMVNIPIKELPSTDINPLDMNTAETFTNINPPTIKQIISSQPLSKKHKMSKQISEQSSTMSKEETQLEIAEQKGNEFVLTQTVESEIKEINQVDKMASQTDHSSEVKTDRVANDLSSVETSKINQQLERNLDIEKSTTKELSPNLSMANNIDLHTKSDWKKFIRKKVMGVISRKADKWTGHALQIIESESQELLEYAIQFKNNNVEFNKTYRLIKE